MIKPNTQNARILRALADGRALTTAQIHRKVGGCVLHSRIAELRKKGYAIEHTKIKGKIGANAHQYRLLPGHPPIPAAPEADQEAWRGAVMPRETPRNEANRFRIYRQSPNSVSGDDLDLVGTCATPEEIGPKLIELAQKSAFVKSCVGILDTKGVTHQRGDWILNPFDPVAS